MYEPGDHQHRVVEKRSPPGTFDPKLDTEICNCGAKRFRLPERGAGHRLVHEAEGVERELHLNLLRWRLW